MDKLPIKSIFSALTAMYKKDVKQRKIIGGQFFLLEKTNKTRYDKMQVTKKVTKQVAPDTTAQIFWLKNRKPDKWRDKPAYEDTSELDKLDAILKGLKDNAAHQ